MWVLGLELRVQRVRFPKTRVFGGSRVVRIVVFVVYFSFGVSVLYSSSRGASSVL